MLNPTRKQIERFFSDPPTKPTKHEHHVAPVATEPIWSSERSLTGDHAPPPWTPLTTMATVATVARVAAAATRSPRTRAPWHAVHGGCDRYMVRTIAAMAIAHPRDYARFCAVDSLFAEHARCLPRVYIAGVREKLTEWHARVVRLVGPRITLRPFEDRNRAFHGPEIARSRSLLLDMASWLGCRNRWLCPCLRNRWLCPLPRSFVGQAKEALSRMEHACAHAHAGSTQWRDRFAVVARASSEIRRTCPLFFSTFS